MTNEELKKKIVDILKEAMKPIEFGGDREHASEVHYPTEEEIADALIAAGIGDIREAEHRVEVYKRALHIAHTAGEFAYYVDKAEKEFAEERK